MFTKFKEKKNYSQKPKFPIKARLATVLPGNGARNLLNILDVLKY